jgi:3D (Asp-Asp-Asp) domain-containing protein
MNRLPPRGFGRGLLSSVVVFALCAAYSTKVITAPVMASSDPPATGADIAPVDVRTVAGSSVETVQPSRPVASNTAAVNSVESSNIPPIVTNSSKDIAKSFSMLDAGTEHHDFRATAYSLKGRTASGVNTRPGVIAADPRLLPIGTVVHIEAGRYTGTYTVLDTGGSIKGRVIDIYVPDHAEAKKFGRKHIKVKVLSRGERRRR